MTMKQEPTLCAVIGGSEKSADGSHTVYKIHVSQGAERPTAVCVARRRYTEFRRLHEALAPVLMLRPFPAPKRWMNNSAVREQRKLLLQRFLDDTLTAAGNSPAASVWVLPRLLEFFCLLSESDTHAPCGTAPPVPTSEATASARDTEPSAADSPTHRARRAPSADSSWSVSVTQEEAQPSELEAQLLLERQANARLDAQLADARAAISQSQEEAEASRSLLAALTDERDAACRARDDAVEEARVHALEAERLRACEAELGALKAQLECHAPPLESTPTHGHVEAPPAMKPSPLKPPALPLPLDSLSDQSDAELQPLAHAINDIAFRANAAGSVALAYHLFVLAHSMLPRRPAALLSAANMALKLRQPLEALVLYERALTLPLTEEQAAMTHSKVEQAERLAHDIDIADRASAHGTHQLDSWLECY
ncbi:hypothetical protein AB1Y20_003111 [Prymnesium parvum]|uniref:PX domain-containing protein n=1 Tax=Prymnesium parvum TaxID=97485 RepID=A0AB34JAH2_PRYPA